MGAVEEGSKASGLPPTIPEQSRLMVVDPADGSFVDQVPILRPAEVAALVSRAQSAQPTWAELGFKARGRVFLRAQKWLMENADRVRETIRSETGKTFEDAQLELVVAAQAFGFWAVKSRRYLADERIRSASPLTLGKKLVARYRPVGVVGVIGPWNYPLVNGFCDCVPALMAGNAVVHKPSEVTPLTARLVAEMLADCGAPEGVFSVATGNGPVGEALIDAVDYVMFTGSTATGRKVMERASKTLTPVSLELGGKDPMIVLADANLERAANQALYASMNNAGQICISIERVYVEAPVYDEFLARVKEKVEKIRQAEPHGGPGSGEVGAITFARQLEVIESQVEDAVAHGAVVLAGGRTAPGAGRFYPPTILVDVDHTMKCMTEETFGPLLPIMKVRDAAEAVRLANSVGYALQASVFTRDIGKGRRLADELEAGACCINDAQVNFTAFSAPMGGWNLSGIGSRHGAGGIRKYCHQQTLLVNRFALNSEPYMFPYSKRSTELQAKAMRALYGRRRRR